MLDDVVGHLAPFGGPQHLVPLGPHLVDDSDRGTEPHRGANGEDSDPDDLPIDLGDGNRCGGDGEEGTEVVDDVAPGFRIRLRARQEAGDGGEIGMASAADVDLHEMPLGERFAAGVLLDDPHRGYHVRPFGPGDGTAECPAVAPNVLRGTMSHGYDAAHLDTPGRACATPEHTPLEEGIGCRSTCDGAQSSSC